MTFQAGDRVKVVGCRNCTVGTVRSVADGQYLVDYDDGHATWEDPEQVEAA